jgi:thiol-disulfide isomerase/thioredoxin
MNNYIKIGIVLVLLAGMTSMGWLGVNLFNGESLAGDAETELGRLITEMNLLKVDSTAEPIPFKLKDLNGKMVGLSDYRGKIVFLNFWTTWCPTCRIEMPSMEKLHQKFKNQDFAMVTINLQESASQVKSFFKEYKLTFTALLDSDGEVGIQFRINAIPTTYILDKEGRIIAKAIGPREWDSKKSIVLFEHLTNKLVATSALNAAR